MIDNASIVNDTRNVRKAISDKFNNDPDKYIDYLLSKKLQKRQMQKDKDIESGANPPLNRTEGPPLLYDPAAG